MEQTVDIERIKSNIELLKSQLQQKMPKLLRAQKLNLLRDYLGTIEKEEDKVKYDVIKDNLEYTESLKIGMYLIQEMESLIKGEELLENKIKLNEIMIQNYYYLARYLYSYFAIALEFGIEKPKQFLAPRTCVLYYVNWELTKFYYKDRAVMTISMPQGTGKTENGKRFMAWAVGKNPDLPKMMVSYSANIAKDKFYNGVMTLVDDENGNYQKIFPNLKLIYKSADTMSLDYRNDGKSSVHSEYTLYCAGFDGSITGRTRAHDILYVDDLVKNIEEASNKDVMDKKWDEFTGTLKKRMQGHCKLLLIGTIFSINDPLSRIIEYYKKNAPDRIKVIKIPGLNENNESNFNYKYGFAITTEMFLEDKDLMDTVSFECLIQQNPIERFGILFSEDEMNKYEEYNDEENFVRNVAAVDVAWGGGDDLSMPICSEYKNGDCPLIDVYVSKEKKEDTIPAVVNKIIEHHITHCHFEANNGGDMYADAVKEELKKKGIIWCAITCSKAPTTKSKLDRILSSVGFITGAQRSEYRMMIKKRVMIKNNMMYNYFLDMLFKFSQTEKIQGKQHDDIPDSLASLAQNVLGCKNTMGQVHSNYSREELGI